MPNLCCCSNSSLVLHHFPGEGTYLERCLSSPSKRPGRREKVGTTRWFGHSKVSSCWDPHLEQQSVLVGGFSPPHPKKYAQVKLDSMKPQGFLGERFPQNLWVATTVWVILSVTKPNDQIDHVWHTATSHASRKSNVWFFAGSNAPREDSVKHPPGHFGGDRTGEVWCKSPKCYTSWN